MRYQILHKFSTRELFDKWENEENINAIWAPKFTSMNAVRW